MPNTDPVIADQFCRSFLRPADRALATHELAALGSAALPVLRAIFSGEARNDDGIPYRQLGMPVECSLVAIKLLGATARPLEPFVRAELASGHAYAEDALRAIGE